MQLAAIQHSRRTPYLCPMGENQVRLILKAARGDLAAATCLHGPRHTLSEEYEGATTLERLGDDGLHDYWGATLAVPSRHLRYVIHLEGRDGESCWLTDFGLTPQLLPRSGFEYPYIHRADRFRQPGWLRPAVLYEIFPDRFCNGDPANDPPGSLPWGSTPAPESMMTGGDLAGIRQKLDYLSNLGIGTIYLTPIFPSPTNHKYDTSDYTSIDPQFGDLQQLKALVDDAHDRSIRVILDGVFNHSGDTWFAFRDVVAQGAKSPYAGWFYDLRSFPVDPVKGNYECFSGRFPHMPKLDTAHPAVRAHLLGAAEYWVREAGIDGWRLDVADEVDHGFWREFRQRIKALKPDAFIMGEVWRDPTDWLQGDQFDSVMNYPWWMATTGFLTGRIDLPRYDRMLTRLRFTHPPEVARGLVNLLSSHDIPRIRTLLGSREKAAQAAVLLMTAEGVPMIYYGDEVGMEGEDDPDCRRCYPWDEPDQIDRGIASLYRRLIAIRNRFPWLNDGAWRTLQADAVTGLYAFLRLPTPLAAPDRPAGEQGLCVVLNTAGRERALAVPACGALPTGGYWADLLAGEMQTGALEGDRLTLPAYGIAILAPPSLTSV